ncbi:hypothetical protein A5320_08605 [Rheinheimera sp. SA_1]|uniref:hypothetical protein n=1 Tax=Rheinheimera sp. SA_1 TaxID=1827365 RepID=UPI0007FBDE17|nr:hypothetical protein [Rheinheimera sp. SA_1]OBP15409.1 hypothetical protein A5320_08605 [Rheinheimera sp. SA_1]
MTLSWSVQLQQQRDDIEMLLQTEAYPIELFAELWQTYQQSLESCCSESTDPADLESILADNLQWVTLIVQQVSSEKDAVAAKVLQLQKGKRAQQSYGDNN